MDDIETVRKFIGENFLFDANGANLGVDDHLIQSGTIDSTGVLELIMFLEERFGIKMDDDEMVPENLDTIARIAAFVARKRAQ